MISQPKMQALFPLGNKHLVAFLVALMSVFLPWTSSGQTNSCIALDCDPDRLFVQVIPDPDFINASSCQSSVPCGGGDLFRQLYFKVRLVYIPETINEPLNFNLDYQKLNIDIQTQASGATAGLAYSFIDAHTTLECHDETALVNGWTLAENDQMGGFSNGVIFSADEQNASIYFQNISTSCPDDAVIQFAQSTNCIPGHDLCAVADLFRIAVNAFPDETVDVKVTFSLYDVAGEAPCSDITPIEVTDKALFPATAIPGSTNGNLLVSMTGPTALPGGGCSVDVEIVNNNAFAIDIDYLEFIVKAELFEAMEPIVNSSYDRPALAAGSARFIHFIVPDEGWQLVANGGMQTIGTIMIKPPVIGNGSYDAELSLINVDKSRVKTPGNCTSLPLSSQSTICQGAGQEPCTNNEGVVFTLEGGNTTGCDMKIRFGFTDTETSSQNILQLKDIAVKLQITTSGDVEFDAETFSSNWNNGCHSSNTCNQCITTVKTGNVINFEYCVSIPNNDNGRVNIDLTGEPNAFVELFFTGPGCIESVTIPELFIRKHTEQDLCIPVLAAGVPPFPGIPACTPILSGSVRTEENEGVSGVTITLSPKTSSCNPNPCSDNVITTGASGAFGFCPCPECQYFSVMPFKDDNHLNGVSTFDLVLISRHILGLEPLDSPYKIIAADADKSNSVTTFDIIELRKLILGIFNDLPNNTSWRFIDKAFTFSDTLNPFMDDFPESVSGLDTSSTNNFANFIAVKVGDVNYSASPSRPSATPLAPISWPGAPGIGKAKTLSVPIVYTGKDTLTAFQMALQFDQSLLQLISPTIGDLPGFTLHNCNVAEAAQGRLRLLWFPTDPYDESLFIPTGSTLFYLHFRVRAPLPEGELPLQIDNSRIPGRAWAADGSEFELQYDPGAADRLKPLQHAGVLEVACMPNPGSTDFTLTISAPDDRKARIALYDANGVRMAFRDLHLTQGEQSLRFHEAAAVPSGVYVWKVIAPGEKVQGHWVKMND